MEKKSTAPLSVDQYIASQPALIKTRLQELREAIKKAAPKADELISYSMPAYKFHGMLAYFAGYKNHYGLYIMPDVLKAFKEKLTAYTTSKATIQFPLDKPLPKKLVADIIKYGTKYNLDKLALKEAAKKIKKTK